MSLNTFLILGIPNLANGEPSPLAPIAMEEDMEIEEVNDVQTTSKKKKLEEQHTPKVTRFSTDGN